MMPRIAFQSGALSLSNSHTDSKANLIIGAGFAMVRISAKCFFLMLLTAKDFYNFFYCIIRYLIEGVNNNIFKIKLKLIK